MCDTLPAWRFDADYLYGNMIWHYDQKHYTKAVEHAVWLIQLLDDETREHQVEVDDDLMCADAMQSVMAEAAAYHVIEWYEAAREAHLRKKEASNGSSTNVE